MDTASLVQGHRRSRVQQLCGVRSLHDRGGNLPAQRPRQDPDGRKAALVHTSGRDLRIGLVLGLLAEWPVPGSAASLSPLVGAECDRAILIATATPGSGLRTRSTVATREAAPPAEHAIARNHRARRE